MEITGGSMIIMAVFFAVVGALIVYAVARLLTSRRSGNSTRDDQPGDP